jgi:hypothetical protein
MAQLQLVEKPIDEHVPVKHHAEPEEHSDHSQPIEDVERMRFELVIPSIIISLHFMQRLVFH